MSDSRSDISFVGAGALGQVYSGLLAISGQPVTLIATPAGAERLASAGCIRLRGIEDHDVPVSTARPEPGRVFVTPDASRLPAASGLIFTTKGHQIRVAAERVLSAWPSPGDGDSWVAGVQNGLAKDDILAEVFGRERVVGAVTITAGTRQDDGSVHFGGFGATYFGELDDSPATERVSRAVAAFSLARLPAEAPSSIQSALWAKACNAAGIFAVSCLARLGGPRMMAQPEFVRAYLALVRETASIAAAYGVTPGDFSGFPIATYLAGPEDEVVSGLVGRARGVMTKRPGPDSLPSMTADLLSGRPLEVDEVFGDLVRRADRANVPAPGLRFVTNMLLGIDPARWR